MSTKDVGYRELLTEYRVALALWPEARVLYGPDRPELISAAIRLQEIQDALEVYRSTENSLSRCEAPDRSRFRPQGSG
jgi:hypothetical protein